MGLNDYLLLLLGFQRVALMKRERKDCLLMHAFLSYSSLFSYHFFFSCFLALGSSPLSMAIATIYTGLILWDSSILPLGRHQLFLVCDGHLFRVTHQPIGCQSATTTRHAQCILFLPLLVTWQISLLYDLAMSLSFLFEWIRPGVSHYLPL